MQASSLEARPRCPTRSEPWQSVSHPHLSGLYGELVSEKERQPHHSFAKVMLYSGLVANIYSRLGIDPSFVLYVWNKYIRPRIHRIQQRRSKASDVEGGDSSGQHNRDRHEASHRSQPRVGYGVVGAAMLPAIL